MVRHKGPRSSPGKGVLVEGKLDWAIDPRNAQRRIEFSQCGREPPQIRSVS